ncbi:hypothetical protein KC959_01075 [Candidatus Saccharibacteria bacterium]|nr:hypothetical protein [Candidatus Saccharibacteria bacterium]
MNSVKKLLKPFQRSFNAVTSIMVTWNFRKLAKNMAILAVLIGLAGGYLWYSRLYLTNERRFWMAIENSMATQSVTRTLISGGSGNKVTQTQQFFFSPQMASRSHVSFIQKNATVDTAVETEGISFPGEQYSRYNVFRTNQKKPDGSSPSLEGILGKWEGTKVDESESEQARLNYISELVTLAVFGNYDAAFRREVISELQSNDTFRVLSDNISTQDVDGRELLVVPVRVSLRNYVTILQKAFVEAGYGEFDALNPENYQEQSAINAKFLVEPKNNTIVGIEFGSRQESYSGYGIQMEVTAPQTDFNSGQLEQIVQEEIGSVF